MFNKIDISEEIFQDYTPTQIENLSKVNLFIGQNNAGKSRLIRKIFENEKVRFIPDDLNVSEINKITNNFYYTLHKYFVTHGISSFGHIVSTINSYKPLDFITTDFSPKKNIYDSILKITNSGTGHSLASDKAGLRDQIEYQISEGYKASWNKLKQLLPDKYSYQYDNLYFPTLRGLRPTIKGNHTDYHKARTIEDYFKLNAERLESKVYTGLTFYDELKRMLLGKHDERERVAVFEDFLSTRFFKNERVNLIPNIDDDVVYIKIGKEEDYPIYKLGDGIQMIIILMYPLFFRKEERLKVFIEEPELYLHPGMQRILLDALTDRTLFPQHQFFISTHSNHFLDMTADFERISVYTLTKDSDFKFEIKNVENADSDVLNILGVKNSSVFLSNCTIWVEGITDRIYLRKYLEVYFESISETNIKEDLHYSFVEYGGGNITHWSFLDDADPEFPNIAVETLCGKLFLVSDKDGAGLKKDGKPDSRKKKKYERHQQLETKLGSRYFCLQSREIENLLTSEVLKNTIEDFEKKNYPKVVFNKKWSWDFYRDRPIGAFIDKNTTSLSRVYQADSGTINEKLKFAKRAVSHIKSIGDLSKEAKELCERLYSFIKKQNKTIM